jgi:hypothetical protein
MLEHEYTNISKCIQAFTQTCADMSTGIHAFRIRLQVITLHFSDLTHTLLVILLNLHVNIQQGACHNSIASVAVLFQTVPFYVLVNVKEQYILSESQLMLSLSWHIL